MTALPRPSRGTAVTVALVLVAVLVAVLGVVVGSALAGRVVTARPAHQPPPPEGYWTTQPVGRWRTLPGDRDCAREVHRSTWEPRADNLAPNHRMPDREAVRTSFAERPRGTQGGYDLKWDRWLLPRVSGQFTGTTDEIIQWAACKWGLSDNVLRAIATQESGWYQGEVYPDGGCVAFHGCGDFFTEEVPGSRVFCRQVSRTDPPTQRTYEPGLCPRTFSIVGVMAWHDPAWGRMPGNQNGTFPFSRQSTAFALDYLGSFLRGCYEGWVLWLGATGDYRPGELHRCAGVWFGGAWDSSLARDYVERVEDALDERPWLLAGWVRLRPPCDPKRGCPQGAP